MPKPKRGRRGKGKKKKDDVDEDLEEIVSIPHDSQEIETEDVQDTEEFVRNDQESYMIPSDVKQYFLNAEKMMDTAEEMSEQDFELFIENVFKEVENNELALATDYDCSRALEKLLRNSNDFQVRVFADKLKGRFYELMTNQFASHVIQTLFYLACDLMERNPETDDDLPSMTEIFLNVVNNEITPHVSTLMTDRYGSHVLRLIIQILSGSPIDLQRSKRSQEYNERTSNKFSLKSASRSRTVPPEFQQALENIVNQVLKSIEGDTELRVYATHAVANPVLQLLVTQTNSTNLIERIVGDLSDPDHDSLFYTLLHNSIGAHLLQQVVKTASPTLFHQIYIAYFRNGLVKLAKNNVANFVVQDLLANCHTQEECELMLQEVGPHFGEFLSGNRAGVVQKMLQACVKWKKCQKDAVKYLNSAFASEETSVFEQLLHLKTDTKFSLPGALILEHVFNFLEEHNKTFVKQFLNTDTTKWPFDAVASRVLESLLLSPQVSTKIKRKVLKSFTGKFVEMSCDKYASHVVDKLWTLADIKDKQEIADEMVQGYNQLAGNHYGKMVLRNCRIDQYKKKREDWMDKEVGIDKKKDMFSELIEGVEPKTVEKKSKKEMRTEKTEKIEEDKKRKRQGEDVDFIFDAIKASKKKK